ncbi:MAG: glycosyltransferase family 9 protein [Kutzneria sp.]|nr:glycosyltransferase family 9 protein [Kutzneria sp.]MBV9846580.1 glycosyltransferase family 9 protein [Kutzneria sp.]
MPTPTAVILRALKLGDLLVAVPALRAIRAGLPEHRLVLATSGWLAPIVGLIGCVDEILPVSGLVALRGVVHPDVAVNLHGAGPESNALLDALHPVRRIGHGGHGWSGPRWIDGTHERRRWCRMLRAHGFDADPDDLLVPRPRLPSLAPGATVIHPGAAFGSRRWPVERFAEVARAFGGTVVVTGSEHERELALTVASVAGLPDRAALAGRIGLLEMAALVANARLVVSADTGIAHLSYAFGTPSVVLFGPAPAEQWGPPPDGPHYSLTDPSVRRGDPFADDADPALLAVTPAAVLAAARRALQPWM